MYTGYAGVGSCFSIGEGWGGREGKGREGHFALRTFAPVRDTLLLSVLRIFSSTLSSVEPLHMRNKTQSPVSANFPANPTALTNCVRCQIHDSVWQRSRKESTREREWMSTPRRERERKKKRKKKKKKKKQKKTKQASNNLAVWIQLHRVAPDPGDVPRMPAEGIPKQNFTLVEPVHFAPLSVLWSQQLAYASG